MPERTNSNRSESTARGFSIVEMLVVIGVIATLLAILLPALSIARRNALWATSQANLREIGQLLVLYSGENREAIVPTAFDYRENLAKGKPRSASPDGAQPPIGPLNYGSWCDILWTTGKFGPIAKTEEQPTNPWDYRFDSPDAALYEKGFEAKNIFRSAEQMQKIVEGNGATPFGNGVLASEKGEPGYFGGNPFFDARPPGGGHQYSGNYWVTGQIKAPSLSMYCMDSNVGELLTLNTDQLNPTNTINLTGVEWRYSGGYSLCLFLDGHVDSVAEWQSLRELELDYKVRVLALDRNRFFQQP
jgi:prepilin-type N-terminal cleavage/methylation domain-containing protein